MISRVPTWLRIALGVNALGLGVWLPRRLRRRMGKTAWKKTRALRLHANPNRSPIYPAPIDLKTWLQDGRLPPAIQETTPAGQPTPDAKFLRDLYGVIQDHNFTVAGLSATLHRSERQLERRIRRLFGMAPRQMLVQVRLYRSMDLLRVGESVKSTALVLGFSTQQNFSRFFKTKTGLSPQDYRGFKSW